LNNHFSFEGLKSWTCSQYRKHKFEFASREAPKLSVDGDFGCVKFIKASGWNMILVLQQPKVMFSSF
jgi:hypothetical protein